MQLGFSTALDTQGSQAFGAGDLPALRACLVTAMALGAVAALPMLAALLATRPVAIALFRQPPAVATSAAQFCVRLVPGVIPQVPPYPPPCSHTRTRLLAALAGLPATRP